MPGFRHKDSKAQSGTKESKKKKVTLSASFCFCVFVAIKHTPKENFNTAYIANQYRIKNRKILIFIKNKYKWLELPLPDYLVNQVWLSYNLIFVYINDFIDNTKSMYVFNRKKQSIQENQLFFHGIRVGNFVLCKHKQVSVS
jgi:hypothetical protein